MFKTLVNNRNHVIEPYANDKIFFDNLNISNNKYIDNKKNNLIKK
jgi:hypothetical protein